RALEVVKRQSSRLTRLVDDLLLAARARSDGLPFTPGPVDLGATVTRAREAVAPELPDRTFAPDLAPSAHLLADERLLLHALTNLLAYAAAVTPGGVPIPARLELEPARARVRIELVGSTLSASDVERAFGPFGAVQYEGGGVRNVVGLYLAREIAR